MTAIAFHRLAQGGSIVKHLRHSLVAWDSGVIGLRNSRIADEFWSNLRKSVEDELHSVGRQLPVVYLLIYWEVDVGVFHAWAVPENVFFDAAQSIPALSDIFLLT